MRSLLGTMLARIPRWMIAVGDQALVALVNLVMSILVARIAGVVVLGRFAVITTTILLCIGVARMLVSDPWLASRRAGSAVGPELRWLIACIALGTLFVVAVVVTVSGEPDAAWYVACVIAVLFVLQDFGRYAAFRSERPLRAFASDALVLVGALVTCLVWSLVGPTGISTALVSWAVGLAVGTIVAWRPIVGRASPAAAWGWWRSNCRPLALKLSHDGLAFLVAVNGSLYLLAYVGTQRDVGVVRVVQTVFSPVALTITGLSMWLVPFLAHRDADQIAGTRRRATVMLTAGSVPLVLVAVVLGPWLTRLVFDVPTAPDRLALWLAGLSTVAVAVAAPWIASVRVMGNYSPIAWARTLGAAVTFAGLAVSTSLRGTNGYLGLMAMQSLFVAAAAFWAGTRARRVVPEKSHSGTSRDPGLAPSGQEG